jgi:hypothetical protein
MSLGQPDAEPAKQDRRQGQADPTLAIGAEPVPGEPSLELD